MIGEDYDEGDVVTVRFDGIPFADDQVITVDENGEFTVTDTVPAGIDPASIKVAAARGRAPEAVDADFEVVDGNGNGGCWKILGICWWWWLLILILLLLLLWLLLWLWCRRRYPFCPGEEIRGSGWIMCEGDCDCRYRRGRCVSDGGTCPDGCSCELFRRKVFGSEGRWERVAERTDRYTWCYRCACARRAETGVTAEAEIETETTEQ